MEVLLDQAEIGPVNLTNDGTNFYLGFAYRKNSGDDPKVRVERHPQSAGGNVVSRALDDVFPGFLFRSSPALSVASSSVRIAVVATEGTQSGMYKVQLNANDLTAVSEDRVDTNLDYANYSIQVSPHFLKKSAGQLVAIWPFQGIRTLNWIGTDLEVFSFGSTTVTDLAPLSGAVFDNYGAVVDAKVENAHKLMLWSQGKMSLDGEFAGSTGQKQGIASAIIPSQLVDNDNTSLVVWSQQASDGRARMKYGTARCDKGTCTSESYLGPSVQDHEAVRPAVDVQKEGTHKDLRRVAMVYAVHGLQPSGQFSTSVLAFTIEQLNLANPGFQPTFEELAYNPPFSLLTTPDYEAPIDPLDSPFRSTAVSVTPGGKIMVAWVYQKPNGPASLWYQRFRMEQCSSP
jgi:hypothetical protein